VVEVLAVEKEVKLPSPVEEKSHDPSKTPARGVARSSAGVEVKIVEVEDTEAQRKVEDEMMRQAGFRKLEIANWFIQKNQLAFMAFCGFSFKPDYARVVKETEKAYLLEFPRLESFSREESVKGLVEQGYIVLSAVKNKKYNVIYVWKTVHKDTVWIPKVAVKFL
jgi:hypothetical protein